MSPHRGVVCACTGRVASAAGLHSSLHGFVETHEDVRLGADLDVVVVTVLCHPANISFADDDPRIGPITVCDLLCADVVIDNGKQSVKVQICIPVNCRIERLSSR